MEKLTSYQINFLMAIGMAVTAISALLIVLRSFVVPAASLPLGVAIGLMMALGSSSYVLSLAKSGLSGRHRSCVLQCLQCLAAPAQVDGTSWLRRANPPELQATKQIYDPDLVFNRVWVQPHRSTVRSPTRDPLRLSKPVLGTQNYIAPGGLKGHAVIRHYL